jgi:hypothetical protein
MKNQWHFLLLDDFVAFDVINRDNSLYVIDSLSDTHRRRFEADAPHLLNPAAPEKVIVGMT